MQRRTRIYLAVGAGVFAFFCILVTILAVSVASFIRADPTEPLDRKFGDQHLKTAVALIELHKVRYGEYPETLDDLTYTGEWDPSSWRAWSTRQTLIAPPTLSRSSVARLESRSSTCPRFLARHGLQ